MKQRSVKQRVLEILRMAMCDSMQFSLRSYGYVIYRGQKIGCCNGWVAKSVFANPTITGSTEGKRRLRELRADPNLQAKYVFEVKHKQNRWYYRIMPRKQPSVKNLHSANRLQFMEV